MRRVALLVGPVLGALLLAGCTSEPAEPPAVAASATATEAPTATSTPSPTDGIREQPDPELGIVFEDVPDLQGDEAAVYDAIAAYDKEYWRTLTTNTVSPGAALVGSAGVQARLQEIADNNARDQARVGGVLHVRISGIVVQGDTAAGTVCDDYRDVTFADVDGTYTPAEAGFGDVPHKTLTLSRVAAEDRWVVETNTVEGGC